MEIDAVHPEFGTAFVRGTSEDNPSSDGERGATKAVGVAIPGTYRVGGRRMSRSRDRVRDSSLQDR